MGWVRPGFNSRQPDYDIESEISLVAEHVLPKHRAGVRFSHLAQKNTPRLRGAGKFFELHCKNWSAFCHERNFQGNNSLYFFVVGKRMATAFANQKKCLFCLW